MKVITMGGVSPVIVATVWMVGTLFSFIAMALSGRALSDDFSTFQILFFRSLIGLVSVSVLLCHSGWRQIRSSRPLVQLARNVVHFGGQYGWFLGVASIPLAEVFAIEFTVPLWTAILASVVLKEKLTLSRLFAIGLGFSGMLIVLRPGLIEIQPAAVAVLAGAVCYATSHTITKYLSRYDTPLAILFYMSAIQLPLGLLPSLHNWVTPGLAHLPWLFMVGVTGLTAHYCMTRALMVADATVVVPMDFLRLPLIAITGALFFAEPVDWLVMLGALVMLIGNVVNIHVERKRPPAGIR